MKYNFPYDEFEPLEIPDANLSGVYHLSESAAVSSERQLIRAALDSPIGAGRLSEQVKPGMKISIAVDDSSRNTRTDLMLPAVLAEISSAGIDAKDVSVFIALGTHRPMNEQEIREKYTKDIARHYRVVNPDWKDDSKYLPVGKSSRGFTIKIHKEIVEADYVIGVGQTIPHMIAGFGGGSKIINPGCADVATIGHMHWMCSDVPDDKLFAVRDNRVREVIDEVALKAGLRFIINEVPGGKGIAGVFAGHPVVAHRKACDFAVTTCEVKIREKSDIVLADAYPADIDFWQALKGLNAACRAVKDGGTVILVTPCPEGTSAQHDELTTIGYIPVERIKEMVARGELDKCVAANLLLGRRLLDRARVILVTKGISQWDTKAMGFDWVPEAATALEQALGRHGKQASINVLHKASKMICNVR
ncbi:MAG: nickel-dependent lactate racemase [Phycisphaerae bacterium]|nr:nickel-dependent lactate racemase [Phycisphaerae bacterium]